MAIDLDKSKFGTNNETTDLIEMSLNLYHVLVFSPETS